MNVRCVLLCFAAVYSYSSAQSNDTKKIHLLTLLPYPNASPLFSPSFSEGINIIPALDLAAQHVNQREGFLDGYELDLIHRDGGCDIPTTTYLGLVSGLFVNSSVVGVVGTGCSSSTIGLLSTVNVQNRTSYIAVHGAGSPRVTRAAFPNSFGTIGLGTIFSDVVFGMMNQSGWRDVAILVDPQRPFYVDTARVFENELPVAFPNANILFSIPVFSFFIPLEELRDNFARVTFIFAGPALSQQILCLALRYGMTYPAFQWIVVGLEGRIDGIAFTYEGVQYNCTGEELSGAALNGNFILNYKLLPFEEDEPTDSGLTYREYLQQYNASVMAYNSNLENSNNTIQVSMWATYFYDAVWAWAVVLDNVTKSGNFSIEEYQFDQPNDALIEQFEQVDFEGVSGRIKFDRESGSVNRVIDIFQVFNGSLENVAYFDDGTLINIETIEFIQDSFPSEPTIVHPAISILFTLLLIVLTVITIVTHVLVIVNHDFKSIKASSAKVNHLAYIGVYFLLISFAISTVSYAFELEGQEGYLCQAIFGFFFPYGFTLAFGTAIVRTWRLYRIFNHYLNPGKLISDHALFVIVLSLLTVDVIVSIVWTSIDPFQLVRTIDASNITAPLVRQRCSSTHYFVWLALVIGYHLLQLAALLVLACITRKIRNKSFKTATLQVLVYGTVAVFGIGAPLYYFAIFANLHVNINYGILGAMLNAVILLYVACVFVPPIVPLINLKWKDSGYGATFQRYSHRLHSLTDNI